MDQGHIETEKLLAALERRIKKIYGEASKEMQKKADAYFAQFAERDKKQKALLDAGKITEQQYRLWRLNQMGRGERFIALRDDLAKRMTEANKVANSYINDETPGIYSLNHNYAAYEIEKAVGDVGFTIYDEQTVRRLIQEDPTLLPARRVDAPKDLKWNKKKFSREITAGIMMGESIGKLANRVQNLSDANRSGAVRNARTAVTGAQNAGRQESYNRAAKRGIKLEKQWLATKDFRTRHAHAMMDHQVVPFDKPFVWEGAEIRYPGDPTARGDLVWNCRCTMRADIDISLEAEPRKIRVRDPLTGRNVVVEDMTYSQWEEWVKSRDPQKYKTEKKKAERSSSDKTQYANYKSVLKGKAGKTFEEFQNLKYNDTERWEFMKLDYARRNKLINHPELALPNAENATAADAKFTGYLFNPKNPKGWAKGKVMTSRLGYSADNWEELRKEIIKGSSLYVANHVGNNGYGELYEQKMVLYGKKGTPANVIVAWIQKEDGSVNMTSAYIKEVK